MSDFTTVMNEMREYHKSALGQARPQAFVPSTAKLQTYLGAAAKAAKGAKGEGLAKLKLLAQSLAQDESATIKNGIVGALEGYRKAGNGPAAVDAFKKTLEQQRDAAKSEASRDLDKLYDEAIALGEKEPGIQGAVAYQMGCISDFFSALFERISEFLTQAWESISTWLSEAWANIQAFFTNLWAWIASWFD
ncbi:MAG: hypothetical protein ABWY06_13735 [Pseudomonas sp.]|uniref:hypothetical protein n=1 Tax=Pseudomonas sp. TaxID=306 RepID=UPI0033921A10